MYFIYEDNYESFTRLNNNWGITIFDSSHLILVPFFFDKSQKLRDLYD